jgi:hypothetical protein
MASQRRSVDHARPAEEALDAELQVSIGATTVVPPFVQRGRDWSARAANG